MKALKPDIEFMKISSGINWVKELINKRIYTGIIRDRVLIGIQRFNRQIKKGAESVPEKAKQKAMTAPIKKKVKK